MCTVHRLHAGQPYTPEQCDHVLAKSIWPSGSQLSPIYAQCTVSAWIATVTWWCHDHRVVLQEACGRRLRLMPSGSFVRWRLPRLDLCVIERVRGVRLA
jgi:hypothetical protein